MMMMEADSSLKLEDRPGLAPTIHDFDIMKPISRGAFGKVFLCHRKDAPEKTLAVKVMKKSELVQKNMVDQVKYKHDVASCYQQASSKLRRNRIKINPRFIYNM